MLKKLFLITTILGFIFLSHTGKVFAYDEHTTHPALTAEIVDFYNLKGGNITSEQKEWIVQGATEEDTPPRWVNHFYDPIHNIAWTGDNTGWLPQSVVEALLYIGFTPEGALTAKDWVNNQLVQEKYNLYGGDRTWKRGLKYFADGNEKEAYITLGHALHLLEDMTVPEHTRNDPHAHDVAVLTGDYGSPYEEYTKKWTRETIGQLHIAGNLAQENVVAPIKPTIEEYLTSAAEYSNKYFFSKDTINDPKYSLPKIMRDDENFGYGVDERGQEFPLARIRTFFNEQGDKQIEYLLKDKNETQILDAYFSRLSRQAVLNGAGVIALFKKQAEDAVVNKEFPQHLVLIDSNIARWFSFPVVSLVGEGTKIWSATKSAYATVVVATGNTFASIGSFVSGIFSNSPNNTTSTSTSTTAVVLKIPPPQAPPPPTKPPLPPTAKATTTPSRQEPTSTFPAANSPIALAGPPIVLGAASGTVPGTFLGGGGGGNGSTPPPPPPPPPSPPPPPPPSEPPPLFSQPIQDQISNGSHYSDNWYRLGSGYSGTLRSLMLRGRVDGTNLATSHIWLKEFKDSSYANLVNTFTISDNAPFTNDGLATTTFDNLSIILKPYFHYRLDTMQDYQNRSVILSGTNTTGTAMFDIFIYGTGRVEYPYPFMPFMIGVGDAATSTPVPPPLTVPGNLTFNFDSTNMRTSFSWSPSTDPDWPANPLHYEIKISTSTDLSTVSWRSADTDPGALFPVILGNSYTVAVRAADNFGAFSDAATATWNFPDGFTLPPQQLDHSRVLPGGAQKITFSSDIAINAIAMWIAPIDINRFCCAQSFLSIYSDNNDALGDELASSTPVTMDRREGDGERFYVFASPVTLAAGSSYWLSVSQGPSPTTDPTAVYGSSADAYADGFWSADPTVDAYFRLLP